MADGNAQIFSGLSAENYNFLIGLDNTDLNTWLRGNMTEKTGDFGKFYVYTGDGQDDGPDELQDMLEFMDALTDFEFGIVEFATTFTYLYSTWWIGGPTSG